MDPLLKKQAPKRKKKHPSRSEKWNEKYGRERCSPISSSGNRGEIQGGRKWWMNQAHSQKSEEESRARKVRIHSEAVVTFRKGNLSYAKILKKFKDDPDLKDLSGNVSKIRRCLI